MAIATMPGCAPPESPARVELRGRLQQEQRLSDLELGALSDELIRSIDGKRIRLTADDGTEVRDPAKQEEVFSLLHNRAGVFDEGTRRSNGKTYRILNGPGRSDNAEIEASQRLWIELATLLPQRYEFTYAFPGYGDVAYDVTVEPQERRR